MADIRSQPEEDGWAEGTIKSILLGDFYENPTFTGLAVRATVSAIPYVDQVADVQDTAAWVLLCRDKGFDDLEVKIGGLLLGIGWIPTIGSVGKGVLKALNSSSTAKSVVKILEHLNFLGQGHGVKWLKEFAADLPKHAKKAAKLMGDVLDELSSLLVKLKGYVPDRVGRKIDGWLVSVAEIRSKIDDMFTEAAEHLQKKLDDALAQFKKQDLDVPTETKTEVSRVQDASPPPGTRQAAKNMKLPPDKADELIQGKYGKYVDPEKQGLASKNTVALGDEDFRKAYLDGGTGNVDNIDGFYDPNTGKLYVNADGAQPDASLLHESLHGYSSDAWRESVPDGFNEGVTEYLTGSNAKELGLDHYSAYPSSTWQAERVARVVGDDTLAEAYFTGNMDSLKAAYEANHLGGDPKTWDGLLDKFDKSYVKDTR
jgi:hypothetical protein